MFRVLLSVLEPWGRGSVWEESGPPRRSCRPHPEDSLGDYRKARKGVGRKAQSVLGLWKVESREEGRKDSMGRTDRARPGEWTERQQLIN